MDPLAQIDAIRMIEARINSIETRINSLTVSGSKDFKTVLSEKLETYGQEFKDTTTDIKQKTVQIAHDFKNEIEQKLKQSDLFQKINNHCQQLCQEIGLDPDLARSMIKVESNFNPDATSTAGAMGLMQLMPGTAAGLGVEQPYDIYQNLKGGISLMKNLLDNFGGNVRLALAAYNAGSARVKEYGDVPPIEETQEYVKKVLSIYNPNLI